jgi:hypothetical protein
MTERGEDIDLGYTLFDADNHYYEPRDCFTRHIESRFRDQAIRPVVAEDETEVLLFGEQVLIFPVVKFDKCEPPGALRGILRNKEFVRFEDARTVENMLPAYRNRRDRLSVTPSAPKGQPARVYRLAQVGGDAYMREAGRVASAVVVPRRPDANRVCRCVLPTATVPPASLWRALAHVDAPRARRAV